MAKVNASPRLPVFDDWCAHADALPTSPEYRQNLKGHVQAFIAWLMEQDLTASAPAENAQLDTVTAALFDAEQLWIELYLMHRAAQSANVKSLATLTCSLKRAYEFWAKSPECKVAPQLVRNPLGGHENQHPLTEEWLAAAKLSGGSLATRRQHIAQYLRFVCTRRSLKALAGIAWRPERKAVEAIRKAKGNEAWVGIRSNEAVAGTLAATLCFEPELIDLFFAALAAEDQATAITIRDRVYAVRKFYEWMVGQGLSTVDLKTLTNPLSQLVEPGAAKPPPPLKPAKPPKPPKPSKPPKPPKPPKLSEPEPVAELKPEPEPELPVIKVLPAFSLEKRRSEHRFNPAQLSALLVLRDELVTEVSKLVSAAAGAEVTSALNRGDLDLQTAKLTVPRAGIDVPGSCELPPDLVSKFGTYFSALDESILGGTVERWGTRTPLFLSLDGGRLFVNEPDDPRKDVAHLIFNRNALFNRLMRPGKYSFRELVEWKNVIFRRELTTQLNRREPSPAVNEVAALLRRYEQAVRISGMESFWFDQQASLFLGCDGGPLTADAFTKAL